VSKLQCIKEEQGHSVLAGLLSLARDNVYLANSPHLRWCLQLVTNWILSGSSQTYKPRPAYDRVVTIENLRRPLAFVSRTLCVPPLLFCDVVNTQSRPYRPSRIPRPHASNPITHGEQMRSRSSNLAYSPPEEVSR
jgi:hypothetical protein